MAALATLGLGLVLGPEGPLIVVAVTVAYLTSEALTAFVDARVGAAPAVAKPESGAAAVTPST